MGSAPELCLRWHSYESSLLMSVCDMWDAGALTDVTVSAGGRSISAHQVVLSSCSGYFKEVLQVAKLCRIKFKSHFQDDFVIDR